MSSFLSTSIMTETLHIMSADLGGTNCRSAIVAHRDGKPELLEDTYRSWDSEHEGDLDFVLKEGIERTVQTYRSMIDGVALAVAGPVEDHRTMLSASNTHCLHDITPFELGAELERRFEKESAVANDLEAACAGEMEQGALRGKKWARLENIGTGWGGAALFNGMAMALEPGHVWLPGNGALCGCGKMDCAEASLSGGAIRRRLQEMAQAGAIEIPNGIDPCAFTDQEAMKGTPWAVKFYTDVARDIGNVWGSNLNNCPEITDIVYMGSFLERAMKIEFVRQQVREAMLARSMFRKKHANVTIERVSAPRLPTGESLGPLYGAASIWKRLHEERKSA